MKHIYFICILVISLFAYEIGNGEVKIIELESKYADEIIISGKKASWIQHPKKKNYKIAFIPASYYRDSDIIVRVGNNVDFQEMVFNILKVAYKKEKLSVDPSKVKPPIKFLSRINKELKEANEVYRTFTPGLFFNSKFELPIDSQVTSPYGTARMFNDSQKSYHSGTDFRAPVGTKVKAANSGIVKIAKDRYYAGGSVIIDHGSGIYTQYYHLSKIGVKVGQKVKKGDVIGLSGATGRVTGPHLHFGVMVNKIQINPLNFIEKTNQLFD